MRKLVMHESLKSDSPTASKGASTPDSDSSDDDVEIEVDWSPTVIPSQKVDSSSISIVPDMHSEALTLDVSHVNLIPR